MPANAIYGGYIAGENKKLKKKPDCQLWSVNDTRYKMSSGNTATWLGFRCGWKTTSLSFRPRNNFISVILVSYRVIKFHSGISELGFNGLPPTFPLWTTNLSGCEVMFFESAWFQTTAILSYLDLITGRKSLYETVVDISVIMEFGFSYKTNELQNISFQSRDVTLR